MYENFILQQFENGKLEGYSWNVDDPEKVICIVHGIGEYGGRFDRVAEAFRERNMAVLAFDLRGHGKSLGKRGHCAPRKDVLSDVSTLIEYAQAIYPEKKLILYGHSMGGNIVLDYRSRGRLNGEVAAYIVTAPWVRLVRRYRHFCTKLSNSCHASHHLLRSDPRSMKRIWATWTVSSRSTITRWCITGYRHCVPWTDLKRVRSWSQVSWKTMAVRNRSRFF